MTVNKLITPPTAQEQINKINEIIDNLGGGGSVDIDGVTITTNSNDEIQTVAVKDNRSGNAIKTWTGTKAQYDAIVTKDSNTLYNIIDDTDVTLTLLELLFPIGAVYFGTMSVCPLQVLGVGTWQALPADKVIQIAGTRGDVGDTLNESLPNITGYVGTSGGTDPDYTGILGYKAIDNKINSGALDWQGNTYGIAQNGGSGASVAKAVNRINFDASNSSSTYQNNAPVQQDAYLLNGWRRIL